MAREQRERAAGVLIDDPHVVPVHDRGLRDAVREGALVGSEDDRVAFHELVEVAERA
jgi:hypothetical protein